MTYFVFEDTENATQVKVHQETCGHVKNEPTKTTKWHKCSSLDDAESMATELANQYGKGWKLAECCF